MKRKIFYLLVVICSLSSLSSAKQAQINGCKKMSCVMEVSSGQAPATTIQKTGMDFELSPIRLLLFDL